MNAVAWRARSVTRADDELLARLHLECFPDAWSAQAMREVIDSAGAFGFVTLDVEASILALALARVAADESELLTIAVAPAWRRHGLARQLITEVVRESRARGALRLFLEVAEDNLAARKLYQSESFRVVGRRRAYYQRPDGATTDGLTMRRDLARGWIWPFAR
jgi:ribosomal-protein-alanine N-acetyltransferase